MYVLWRVIVKEFLQLRQDRRMIPIVFIAPAFQLLLFGYAANLDVTNVPLMLVDHDRSAESRRLLERFTASPYFELVGSTNDPRDIDAWLVQGRAQVALVIGRGFGEAVAAGDTPEVQLIADGSDSTSAIVGLGYATNILQRRSQQLVGARMQEMLRRSSAEENGLAAAPGRIELQSRVWYNPDLKSRWFYVPAVLAMVLMIITMVLSSMGVVREKEIGTMEQVIVTPIKSWQLIIGKLTPFAVIGLIDIFLVTGIAIGWFRVPLRGSFFLLVALTMLFLLNTLGLGLLASTIARTQAQAMMGSAFLLMVPMIYLSGLIFPISNMPEVIQYVTYAIPLRYYATILRGIFLKGAGIDVLWPQAATLAVFGVAVLSLAAFRFRKRLE